MPLFRLSIDADFSYKTDIFLAKVLLLRIIQSSLKYRQNPYTR